MGHWSASILGNDTAAQTWEAFFSHYDAGDAVSEVVRKVEAELRASLRTPDDASNVELALALALWECASLDPARLTRVRGLVSGDLAAKQRLGADAAFLAKRRRALAQLVRKLSKRNTSPRPRRPAPSVSSPFRPGCCFALRRVATSRRGPTWCAFWIVDASLARKHGWLDLVCLDVDQRALPTLEDCERAFVRGVSKRSDGTWEGAQQGFSYGGDRSAFLAAFSERCFVIGHTRPLKTRRVRWATTAFGLDWSQRGLLTKRLRAFLERARAERWARRVTLGELLKLK